VLEQQRLAFPPHPDSGTTRPSWSWDERLILFVAGASIGAFFFAGILGTYLSPPKRPILPDPVLGYTHFFKAKYGDVYGTFFEYLAVTYAPWIMVGVGAIGSAFFLIKRKSRAYPRYPREIFVAAAISIALYYAIWRVSIYVASS
jgi:hypothetical protein